MGYTFAHMELHSRKGGKSGSVSYVFDEAERRPGACPHVPNPAPPELVVGMELAALRQLHDTLADTARTTLANGKTRKIRADQNTLFSVVLSFPGEMASADPEAVKDWERRSVQWLKQEYGDRLMTVVRHVDEAHPHLHAYGLAGDPEMRVALLHPGYAAKAESLAAGEDNKAGDRAYKAAMRAWQDRYWNDVGLACGLARLGPGKRRLTRKEWHAEQTAHKAVRKALRAKKHVDGLADQKIDQTRQEARKIALKAKSDADALLARAAQHEEKAKRAWWEARSAKQAAQHARREAETLLARARDETKEIGRKVGVAWAAAKDWMTGHEARIRTEAKAEVEVQERAKREPLQTALQHATDDLRKERETNRNLRASVQELGKDLSEARQKLAQFDRPDGPRNGPRPGK